MAAFRSSVGAITLFQEDLAEARRFYAEVFGLVPVFGDEDSAAFKFGDTIINLVATRAAGEPIAPVRVAERDAGSRVLLTIWVPDTDAACAELAERGVTLINGPIDRPWGMRTACFSDPGGHLWEFGQDLPGKSGEEQ